MSLETYENWLDEHGELPFGVPTWHEVGRDYHLIKGYLWFVEGAPGGTTFDTTRDYLDRRTNYEALAILQRWHRERLWEDHRVVVFRMHTDEFTVQKHAQHPYGAWVALAEDGEWTLGALPRQSFDDYDAALLAAAGAVTKGDSDADA